MDFQRASGIILHPTSLPGRYGIGDLGPTAYAWIEFLHKSGCSLWQILPLGPTGFGDSPYQCFSAVAGNPYLISPELLLEEDLLHKDDLVSVPDFPSTTVDYGSVIPWKLGVLDRAFIRFQHMNAEKIKTEYESFYKEQKEWIDDFALFMALKEDHGGAPWIDWEPELRNREMGALKFAQEKFASAIQRQIFRQFLFFRQWSKVRQYAHNMGVKIIGDVPIFVAQDSVDVWKNPELFFLDPQGKPTVVSGVPPDYFSPTGQLWGNPLYNWEMHKKTQYRWWFARLRKAFEMVDILRLDHFRGFAGYWEVKAGSKTAENGRWVAAPGMDFFNRLEELIKENGIIAEDLGVITRDVEKLRDHFGFPGMRILQFAFEGNPKDDFLPHNYINNCVVYTGTHDNDTAKGWYERVSENSRDFYRQYLFCDGSDVAWDMIRACWSSVAVFALAPMQDFLSLGNQARMNYPGDPGGNWRWRMTAKDMHEKLSARIRQINFLYDRQNLRLRHHE
jgi:4-alpha-glucanotransferase